MKEYKRLTDKKIDLDKLSEKAKSKISDTYLEYAKMNNALWELENKIENGTLVELPCKVGDKVYFLEYYDYDTCKKECEYLYCEYGFGYECRKTNYGEKAIECVNIKERTMRELRDIFRYFKDFGERVFLTKAEAEKKLKELQNER